MTETENQQSGTSKSPHRPGGGEISTVLVTAATGKTGRQVVRAARAAGLSVRAASRTGEVTFDWHDAATWDAAMSGTDAAYLAFAPDIGHPAAAGTVGSLAERAAGLGVRRVVLLSARGESQAAAAEDALAKAELEWTVMRAAWFAQNLSEGPLLDEVRAGELVFPAGEVVEPFVDTRDIADVVVEVLTGGRFAGRVLELSGPRLLSFREALQEAGEAAGRELGYRPVAPAAYGEALRGFGVGEHEARFLTELFAELLDGRNAHLSDGVREVLGRPARDFADFAAEEAKAGTWRA